MDTTVSRLVDTAARLAGRRPWHALGVAAAAGYLFGGGLFSPLTSRMIGLGVRLKLRELLAALVDSRRDDLHSQ
jgi:hypothetical protein